MNNNSVVWAGSPDHVLLLLTINRSGDLRKKLPPERATKENDFF
jgi:hypothetical protein